MAWTIYNLQKYFSHISYSKSLRNIRTISFGIPWSLTRSWLYFFFPLMEAGQQSPMYGLWSFFSYWIINVRHNSGIKYCFHITMDLLLGKKQYSLQRIKQMLWLFNRCLNGNLLIAVSMGVIWYYLMAIKYNHGLFFL